MRIDDPFGTGKDLSEELFDYLGRADHRMARLPSERRLRSKAHLNFVAAQTCLVCEDLPCHTHHITFAQPRGLSQKVSDEFTVPLCAAHHNELHLSGNEARWWRSLGIEPLPKALALWRISTGNEIGNASTPSIRSLRKPSNEA